MSKYLEEFLFYFEEARFSMTSQAIQDLRQKAVDELVALRAQLAEAQKWTCHDLGCDQDVAAPEARSALDDAVSVVADELKTTWGEQARAELAALRAQLAVDEKLLAERNRLLAAIPECPEHGASCVPHAIEWVEKAKETRTVGTALTMLAQREHEERLARVEAELLRFGALVAPATLPLTAGDGYIQVPPGSELMAGDQALIRASGQWVDVARNEEGYFSSSDWAIAFRRPLLAPAPRTCATCRFLGDGDGLFFCQTATPVGHIPDPRSFGCIHHAPLPPGG